MQLWIVFALGAALSWGAYGVTIHMGQQAFGLNTPGRLKALLCVGVAYFLMGVLVPLATLWSRGELGNFNVKGTAFSTFAGALGALGAICIIWAMANGGKPFTVMPLVFAGAPIINTLIAIALHPPEGGVKSIHPMLYVGVVLAAVGGYLVLAYKP